MDHPTLNVRDYTLVCPSCGKEVVGGRYAFCPHCLENPEGFTQALLDAYHRRRDDYLRLTGQYADRTIILNVKVTEVCCSLHSPVSTMLVGTTHFFTVTAPGCADEWELLRLCRESEIAVSDVTHAPLDPRSIKHVGKEWGEGYESQPPFACEQDPLLTLQSGLTPSAVSQYHWLMEQHELLRQHCADDDPLLCEHLTLLKTFRLRMDTQREDVDRQCASLYESIRQAEKKVPLPFFPAARRRHASELLSLQSTLSELRPYRDFLSDGARNAEHGADLLRRVVPSASEPVHPLFISFKEFEQNFLTDESDPCSASFYDPEDDLPFSPI